MPRSVLLVDDDPLILEVLTTILGLEEFAVRTATGGEAALELVAQHDFEVVVCDVMMPGIDGFETCRRLKDGDRSADIPVILLTARDRPEDRAAGVAAGCAAYLTKPFSPLELIELIRTVESGTGVAVADTPEEGSA